MGRLIPGVLIGIAIIIMRAAPTLPFWADVFCTICAGTIMGAVFTVTARHPTTQEGPKT